MLEMSRALGRAGLVHKGDKKPYFDATVMSGDLTWQGKKDGFTAAKHFVNLLESAGYCSRWSILTIPGNHDMTFVREGEQQWIGPDVELCYREFIREATGKDPSGFLARIKEFRSRGVVLVGLNSTRVIRKDSDELGFIGYDQFLAAMNSLWKTRPQTSPSMNELLIVFLHHHLLQIDAIKPEMLVSPSSRVRYSITLDAPLMIQVMREVNAQVVLHGHQHQRWWSVDQSGDPLTTGGALAAPLLIVGAASAGICHPDSRNEHHFQVMEVADDLLSLQMHHFSADAKDRNVPRDWQYNPTESIPLRPCCLRSPDEDRRKVMDAEGRAWASSYSRLESSWHVQQLMRGGEQEWQELRLYMMGIWRDGSQRNVLPSELRDQWKFERGLDAVLAALRRDPTMLQEYESLLNTGNAMSLDQFLLDLVRQHAEP